MSFATLVRKGNEDESQPRRKARALIVPLLLAGAILLAASPALAYWAGQQVWSQTLTVQAGNTTMGNFKLSDTRPYDLYGKVTTTCSNSAQKWGYKLDEVKAWMPDPTIAKKNWDSPIKTCTEQVVRANLNAGADAYHFVVKVTVSGASFTARVVAR